MLNLTDEVILMRHTVGMALNAYDSVYGNPNSEPAAKTLAGAILRNQLGEVATMVEKAVKVRAGLKGTITPDQIREVVAQIHRILADELEPAQAIRINERIWREVKMPCERPVEGALTVPADEMARMMDESVVGT